MKSFSVAFYQTIASFRLLWLIYGLTLVFGLVAALPLYSTLVREDQNSLAFLNLLHRFDYTVFSDFLHRSGHTLLPLLSVGRWLGLLYIFLNLFLAGGILRHFAQPNVPFDAGMFWQSCSRYVGQFLRLFGVTLLFVMAGAVIWLIAGSLIGIALSDTLTERGQFYIGLVFFTLFTFTATWLLYIGDYAKVIMFCENDQKAFHAFGRASRFVLRNPGQTYGLYCLLILVGAGLFGLYFLIDAAILMQNWLTIAVMFIAQQSLIFARIGLKVWSLGTAYGVYGGLYNRQHYTSEQADVYTAKPEL